MPRPRYQAVRMSRVVQITKRKKKPWGRRRRYSRTLASSPRQRGLSLVFWDCFRTTLAWNMLQHAWLKLSQTPSSSPLTRVVSVGPSPHRAFNAGSWSWRTMRLVAFCFSSLPSSPSSPRLGALMAAPTLRPDSPWARNDFFVSAFGPGGGSIMEMPIHPRGIIIAADSLAQADGGGWLAAVCARNEIKAKRSRQPRAVVGAYRVASAPGRGASSRAGG